MQPAAVLLSRQPHLDELRSVLRNHGIRTLDAPSCQEALRILEQSDSPQLVFTDTELPDGNWVDVLSLREKASAPVEVIVMSRSVDVKLYLDTMELGAFDFIALPFTASDLAYVVHRAASKLDSGSRPLPRSAGSA